VKEDGGGKKFLVWKDSFHEEARFFQNLICNIKIAIFYESKNLLGHDFDL
jgi:hypothetical protein